MLTLAALPPVLLTKVAMRMVHLTPVGRVWREPEVLQTAGPVALGGAPAAAANGWLMDAGPSASMAASSWAAFPMSKLEPARASVDHSVTAGWLSKLLV